MAQQDALSAAGCERVWTDVASGARARRPALDELLAAVQADDTVAVTRLDRFGRSLPHLLSLVENLAAQDVGLHWPSRSTPAAPRAGWCYTCSVRSPSSSAASTTRLSNGPSRHAADQVEYERRSVSTLLGGCVEPSNVKSGGKSCPIRFQCGGCDHYRPDPSFQPAIGRLLQCRMIERLSSSAG